MNIFKSLGVDNNCTDEQLKQAFVRKKREYQILLQSKDSEVQNRAALNIIELAEAYKAVKNQRNLNTEKEKTDNASIKASNSEKNYHLKLNKETTGSSKQIDNASKNIGFLYDKVTVPDNKDNNGVNITKADKKGIEAYPEVKNSRFNNPKKLIFMMGIAIIFLLCIIIFRPAIPGFNNPQIAGGNGLINGIGLHTSPEKIGIIDGFVVAHSEASLESDIIASFAVEEKVTILSEHGEWAKVRRYNGMECFVERKHLITPEELVAREAPQKVTLKKYPSMVDGAALLSASEKSKVLNNLRKVEEKYGIRCAVLTVKSTQGMIIKEYAEAVQDKYYSDKTNGSILLVIDMGNKKWHITTNSVMRKKITDELVTGRLKNVFIDDLVKGNYAKAFLNYGNEVEQLLSRYNANEKSYQSNIENIGLFIKNKISAFNRLFQKNAHNINNDLVNDKNPISKANFPKASSAGDVTNTNANIFFETTDVVLQNKCMQIKGYFYNRGNNSGTVTKIYFDANVSDKLGNHLWHDSYTIDNVNKYVSKEKVYHTFYIYNDNCQKYDGEIKWKCDNTVWCTSNTDIPEKYEAQIVFYNFHRAITEKRLRDAYNLLSPKFQKYFGSYENFASGYNTTISSEVVDSQLVSRVSLIETYSYKLKAVDYDGNGQKIQYFVGKVKLVRIHGEWKIDSAEAKRI